MRDNSKNHCSRIIPGGIDCCNQIQKGKCALGDEHHECSGRTGAITANLERAQETVCEEAKRAKVFLSANNHPVASVSL